MPTVLLVRHGRSVSDAAGTLAGRTPGIALDDVGREQSLIMARRIAEIPLSRIVSSPLQRARATAGYFLSDERSGGPGPSRRRARPSRPATVEIDDRFTEVDFGSCTEQPLEDLARTEFWSLVQHRPSAVRFPDGESLREVQQRALAGLAEHNEAVAREHGEGAVWLLVTHGDVIRALLTDALGLHLDQMQRITVPTGSLSAVRLADQGPLVLRMGETPDVTALAPTGGRRSHVHRPGRGTRSGRHGGAAPAVLVGRSRRA